MTITFTIPAGKISRISAALDFYGYVFNPALGTTDANQRMAFFRKITIENWQSLLFNFERQMAINLDASGTDSAALQAKRFVGLEDVTATWL